MARRNSNSNPRPRGAGPREANARHKRKRAGNRPGTGSVRQEPSAPGSLIGGIRSRGIHAIKPVETNTPGVHELTDEERRAKWQPPERDKAWFSGTSASRHKASSSYKVASDYSPVTYDDGVPKPAKHKKKRGNKISSPVSKKAARHIPPKTGPLSPKEVKILDNNYRVKGGQPQWKGWDTLLPGRSADFLLGQVATCGLDRPDDKNWTKGEKAVLRDNKQKLDRFDSRWARLLPRKSPQAIARAYVEQAGVAPHSPTKDQKTLAQEMGWSTGRIKKAKPSKSRTSKGKRKA